MSLSLCFCCGCEHKFCFKMGDELIVAFINDLVEATEDAAVRHIPRRQGLWRYDAMELSDAAFKKNFRLSKELTTKLVEIVEPVIGPITQYDVRTKVLCALHFLGHGSYQTPVGQHLTINMSQSSVSRCITEIVEALNHPRIFNQWVHFPKTFEELDEIVLKFYNIYRFPGIIGCIDCTHVAIVPPNTTSFDERSYVNRKNYHSINTQLICDADLKILNVNALFPGSTHDCHIWNNSKVLTFMERLHTNGYTNYHLIGDSGYALRPWCLTPFSNPEENSPEMRYNDNFKKARCTIERCNGVLKGRFRCLIKDRVLHYMPNKATKIINACTVLHNMCITHNLDVPDISNLDAEQLGTFEQNDHGEEGQSSRVNVMLLQGRLKQRQIVQNYF